MEQSAVCALACRLKSPKKKQRRKVSFKFIIVFIYGLVLQR
jgi:hypothetical protein